MSTVLSDKDVNQAVAAKEQTEAKVKSMEYHRQVLQSKMESEESVSIPPFQSACPAMLRGFSTRRETNR